jgi:hypothetical protein
MSPHQHLDHENRKVDPKPVGMLVAAVKKLFLSTFSSAPCPSHWGLSRQRSMP